MHFPASRLLFLYCPLLLAALVSVDAAAQVVVEQAYDPLGDTVQVHGFHHDLTRVVAVADDQDLVIRFDFTQEIGPAGTGANNELVGYLDIDFDKDAATGFTAYGELLGFGTVGIGIEGYVDLSSYSTAAGTMNMWNLQTNTTSAVAADFSKERVLVLRIPLQALGGRGDVGLSMLVGNRQWEWTDMAPSAGHLLGLGNHQAQFDGKIVVEVEWAEPWNGTSGTARPVAENLPGDALWWFFDPYHPEQWVRVLDGCSVTQHWWVMFTGMTNVDVTITATHIGTGASKTYQTSGTVAPTTDAYALPCP